METKEVILDTDIGDDIVIGKFSNYFRMTLGL